MNRFYQKYVSSLLGILLVLSLIVPAVSAESVKDNTSEEKVTAMIESTLKFYEEARYQEETFGWDPGELFWTELVALNASSSLLTDGTAKLPDWIETDPGLKIDNNDTEHIRYIFGLLAVGKDPANAWETNRNLYHELAAQLNKEGSFGGVNKQSWAMLALDAGQKLGHDVGTWNSTAKKQALAHLLKEEVPGGGFSLAGSEGTAGPDITAMVLLTLANYQGQPIVDETIARTKRSLHSMQFETGGWGAYNSEDANSTATVISGLIAVGDDPTSANWERSGFTPLDALTKFQLDNGAFAYTIGKRMPINLKATEQAFVALQEIKDGKSVWQQLAEPAPTNLNPTIQSPENITSTIENGRLHFKIKNSQSDEWKPAKVEKKQMVGKHTTVEISESATTVAGMKISSEDKKIVVLHNDKSYTYFDADPATSPKKEWEVKFSAPLLDTDANLKNVTVQNADGQDIAMTVKLLEGTVVKITPSYDYHPGALFYITISDVLSAKGTVVKKPIRKIFVIKE